MLESGGTQLYLRILFANSSKRQRGYSQGARRHQQKCWKSRGLRQFVRGNLSGLLSVCILTVTVVMVLAIGILTAYGSVIGILHALAGQSRPRSNEIPLLAPGQTRA